MTNATGSQLFFFAPLASEISFCNLEIRAKNSSWRQMKGKEQNSLAGNVGSSNEEAPTMYKRNIPWDADNATPKGLSSLGVLLRWIRVPGNFECWYKGGKSRSDAVKTIFAALDKHDIFHRSVRAIDMKVKSMTQQYLAASTVLFEEGRESDYFDQDEIDEHVEKRVQKRCPYYRMVAPILSNFSFSGMEPKDWTTCDDSEDSDYVETGTKRKRKTTSGDRQSRKRRNSPHSNYEDQDTASDSGERDTDTCTELVAVPRQDTSTLEFRRKMEDCKLSYVQKSTHRFLITEREKQECDVKIEQYRVEAEKYRVEMEIRHSEMKMKVDTMLSRQTLKERRISKAEIDQVLPIPGP